MAVVTVPTDGLCDFVLATNANPALSVAYQENGDGMPHSYARANSGKVITQLIEGRAKPIAFRSLIEGDADVFDRTFVVAMDTAGNPLTTVDRVPFAPILALIESDNLIVVCDGHGDRWFTAADFTQGTYTYAGHEHQATVRFAEVDGPIPVVTSNPWT